jgi:hypothetical protein
LPETSVGAFFHHLKRWRDVMSKAFWKLVALIGEALLKAAGAR